jgi:hypothetical protein
MHKELADEVLAEQEHVFRAITKRIKDGGLHWKALAEQCDAHDWRAPMHALLWRLQTQVLS